jgi:hypothetical protein
MNVLESAELGAKNAGTDWHAERDLRQRQRVASADNFENVIHLHGTRSGTAYQYPGLVRITCSAKRVWPTTPFRVVIVGVTPSSARLREGTRGFYFTEGGCTGCDNYAPTDSDGRVQYWATCGGTSWQWRKFDLTLDCWETYRGGELGGHDVDCSIDAPPAVTDIHLSIWPMASPISSTA